MPQRPRGSGEVGPPALHVAAIASRYSPPSRRQGSERLWPHSGTTCNTTREAAHRRVASTRTAASAKAKKHSVPTRPSGAGPGTAERGRLPLGWPRGPGRSAASIRARRDSRLVWRTPSPAGPAPSRSLSSRCRRGRLLRARSRRSAPWGGSSAGPDRPSGSPSRPPPGRAAGPSCSPRRRPRSPRPLATGCPAGTGRGTRPPDCRQ